MAILSNNTYLMHKKAGAIKFEKLADVISVPDLGSAPDMVDDTTLSDRRYKNLNGLQTAPSFEFQALFDKDVYMKLRRIESEDYTKDMNALDIYQLWFGAKGVYGKFEWEGRLSVYAGGVGINEGVPMVITVSDEGYMPLHMADDNAIGTGVIGSMFIR